MLDALILSEPFERFVALPVIAGTAGRHYLVPAECLWNDVVVSDLVAA